MLTKLRLKSATMNHWLEYLNKILNKIVIVHYIASKNAYLMILSKCGALVFATAHKNFTQILDISFQTWVSSMEKKKRSYRYGAWLKQTSNITYKTNSKRRRPHFCDSTCQFLPNFEYKPEVMYSIYSWTIGSKKIRGTLRNC